MQFVKRKIPGDSRGESNGGTVSFFRRAAIKSIAKGSASRAFSSIEIEEFTRELAERAFAFTPRLPYTAFTYLPRVRISWSHVDVLSSRFVHPSARPSARPFVAARIQCPCKVNGGPGTGCQLSVIYGPGPRTHS